MCEPVEIWRYGKRGPVFLATMCGLFYTPALAAQTWPPAPTIRVPVRLVTAPVLVFSKQGKVISGLQRSAFRVFDDGRAQEFSLDAGQAPVSVALAIQANQDVCEYVPFIAKVGSVVESLLVGETGEAAVLAYNGLVTIVKPFDTGNVPSALQRIPATGVQARMIDAGLRGISLLKERPGLRSRVLLFVGQAADHGSESALASLQEQAEKDNVAIYAIALPEFGKAFISDNLSVQGVSAAERGGFKVSVDLGDLLSALKRGGDAKTGTDPFSILTAATSGTRLRSRTQRELEAALATVGVELRSSYLLSYSPSATESGYHKIHIEVDVPGARVCARKGYWMGER